jgi:hypothetical protein
MIAIAERSSESIESSLGGFLHSSGDQCALIGAVAAEYFRAMIFGAALPLKDMSAARTIHTTRLTTGARRAIDLVWPPRTGGEHQETSDICFATLKRMGILGDATNIGQAQWLAAPLRIVIPDNSPSCLLIGTAPMAVVRKTIGTEPSCVGAARFVGQRVLDKAGNRDIAQSVDAWLGQAPPLTEWTAQVLGAHEARMDATQNVSAEQLEIYAPDVLRNQRRQGRWIAAGEINRPLEGVRLCQPQTRYARSYDTPQYLAHFELKNGALSLRRSVLIRRDLTLRLRFGLDVLLNSPRELSIVLTGQTFRIDRPTPLPYPEERIYALGWEDQASQAPERLIFHRDALPVLLHALRRLSLTPSITPRISS